MLLKSFIIAFSMYSKIPMPNIKWDEKSMKYVFCFFPLVGLVIGTIVWLAGNFLLYKGVNTLLFSAVMTVLPVLISGGIHLDGYLDTIDAICSYADKEKRLKILKDPNSGAFAVIGGLCYFTLTFGLWSCIDKNSLPIVALGYVISRALSGFTVVTFPQARKSGLSADFANSATKITAFVLLIYAVVAIILCVDINITKTLVIALVLIVILVYHYINAVKKFGGITGDLAGFCLQLCELGILVGCVVA